MMKNHRISVIMPSFLSPYEGAADNREEKFRRAVNSFLSQRHKNAELIIVSDGCDKTDLLYEVYFSKQPSVRHIRMEKQPLFSGSVRQKGLEAANGHITCYLDSDDILGTTHLSNINTVFPDGYDWVYYNDYFLTPTGQQVPKVVQLEKGSIGTSSIAHLTSLRELGLSWNGCDKYNHDWLFVERLMKFTRYKKVYGCSYNICHIPNALDT